jgi:hypothetical protein
MNHTFRIVPSRQPVAADQQRRSEMHAVPGLIVNADLPVRDRTLPLPGPARSERADCILHASRCSAVSAQPAAAIALPAQAA